MELSLLYLNCALKKSPKTSNTHAFIEQSEEIFNEFNVKTEVVRIVDYDIEYRTSSDEENNYEWPKILKKIKKADMLIIATPICRGDITNSLLIASLSLFSIIDFTLFFFVEGAYCKN